MYGRNSESDLDVVDFDMLGDEVVLVTFSNGCIAKLGIYNWNTETNTILCDDFSTYINY